MPLSVCSLGSGSKGNATIIRSSSHAILVDCGFSLRAIESRMRARLIEPDQIDAVFVTHEHSDHLAGVAAFANKYDLPVWLSYGTANNKKAANIKHPVIISHFLQPIMIGNIEVSAVPVPHDASEACQYVFAHGRQKVGLLTDLGHLSAVVSKAFADTDLLLLEFNYDVQMLATGPYPHALKQRVGGNYGHLSNQQATEYLQQVKSRRLNQVVAMHISEKNNRTELVKGLLETCLKGTTVSYLLATQDAGFDWIHLN